MWRYVLIRLGWAIPTTIIVLVFSFLLQYMAPGDQIAKRLELEGSSITLTQQSYLKAYKKIGHEYGLDLPPFYFSILPSYYPDTLHKVYPLIDKRQMTSLLDQTKDWTAVIDYRQALQIALDGYSESRHSDSKIYAELLKMKMDPHLIDVRARLLKLQDLTDGLLSEDLTLLAQTIDDLHTSRRWSWPSFRWNGYNNRFNKWVGIIMSPSRNLSLEDGQSVWTKIKTSLGWTVSMSLIALLLIAIISYILAYLLAKYHGSLWDRWVTLILYTLIAVPSFWFASLMVVFFTTPEYGAWTDIFPSIGLKPSYIDKGFWQMWLDNLGQLVLPIFCLTVTSLSYITIQLKNDILDQTAQPYVLMARAKGLTAERVLRAHILPNALIPYTTILTGAIPVMFTGSVIIEYIFNIPSIRAQDWPVVYSIVIIISIATIIGYLIGDILLMKLYPKTGQGAQSITR